MRASTGQYRPTHHLPATPSPVYFVPAYWPGIVGRENVIGTYAVRINRPDTYGTLFQPAAASRIELGCSLTEIMIGKRKQKSRINDELFSVKQKINYELLI